MITRTRYCYAFDSFLRNTSGRFGHFSNASFYDAFMRWITRLAAWLLIALAASGGIAQEAPSVTPPTLNELRAQLDKIPDAVESSDEVKRLVAQLAALAEQAQKFADARTGQLTDQIGRASCRERVYSSV